MKDMFVASTLFWQTSLQDMTRQIKTDGLTGLEMWAQQFFYQNYDIEEYKTLAEAYGLRTLVHSCSWDLNLASINESIRQASVGQVIASLQLAKAIGAEEVTVHPGHLTLAGITDRSCQILHHSLDEISEAGCITGNHGENQERIRYDCCGHASSNRGTLSQIFVYR